MLAITSINIFNSFIARNKKHKGRNLNLIIEDTGNNAKLNL